MWLLEAGDEVGWEIDRQSYKFPVIRQISTQDVMYNMTKVINTALHYILKRANTLSPHHKENFLFYFVHVASI